MKQLSIYLADDHQILREGLRVILESNQRFSVTGESGDGRQALSEIEKLKPDIAIVDISMPSMSGIEVARQIKKYNSQIKVIVLSQYDNEEYIDQVLEYGVDGYILKENAGDILINAIDAVMNGDTFLSPRITRHLVEEYLPIIRSRKKSKGESPFSILSDREREILKLIAEGYNNNEIAKSLVLSVPTVKSHRNNIMKKLDAGNVVDLVRYAIKNDMVEL